MRTDSELLARYLLCVERQAEPHEPRWALAAAGAAAALGRQTQSEQPFQDAVARYEAAAVFQPHCTEALQQLAALCDWSGR